MILKYKWFTKKYPDISQSVKDNLPKKSIVSLRMGLDPMNIRVQVEVFPV